MKNIMKRIVCVMLILTAILGIQPSLVFADVNKAYITVSSYKITEGAVIPGQEITLSIVLKNTSRNKNIGNTMVTMQVADGNVFPVYETSNQIYINELNAGEEKEVAIKLKVASKIESESIPIVFHIVYADEKKEDNINETTLYLPVSTSGSLSVQNISVVDQATIGTKARISATYENTGEDEISNITLHVTGSNFASAKEFKFDNLGGGEKNYAEAYIDFNSVGTQKINVSFTYEDLEGITHETEIVSYDVQVSGTGSGGITETGVNPIADTTVHWMVYVILGSAIIILVIIIIVLSRKSKR